MTESEQITIESILQSKRIPQFSFSEEERATIIREQKKLLDKLTPDPEEELEKELKPLLERIKNGDDSGFKNTIEQYVKAASLGIVDSSFRIPLTPNTTPFKDRKDCTARWIILPPYENGGPLDFEEESAIQDGDPHPSLVTRSARAFPNEGRFSIGAANGKLSAFGIIEYPGPDSWLFGDSNSATAGIFHIVNFPQGPITKPETIEVNVNACVDSLYPPGPILFSPGPEGSPGNGLVAVLGKLFLTVYGNTVLNGFTSRTSQVTFLRAWESDSGDSGKAGTTIYEKDFNVSTTLSLKAGESNVFVLITVKIWALRAGTRDEPFSYVAVNFTDKGASQLYPSNFGPPGTPIQIPEIRVAICPFISESIDIVTA